MPKNKQAVPVLPIKKLVNEKGFRISKEAAQTVSQAINELTEQLIIESIELKKVSGSKTIQPKDIKLAIKIVENE